MPRVFKIGEVLQVIRGKLSLKREQGINLMADGGKILLKPSHVLDDIYEKHKDEDGFLYLVYTEENIYG